MRFLTDILGLLAFRTRSLRVQAERQSLVPGVICFSAGFLAFSIIRNTVYAMLPELAGQPESADSFFHLNLIQAVLFLLLVYIPGIILLSNSIAGDGLGFVVSKQEYRAHASVLMPLWGLIFLIDAPLQYYAPQFLVIGVFGITIGMLALLLLLFVYTFWAIKQLNYLTAAQASGVFALSWFMLPVYYLLTSFFVALPFFILIPLLYIGYQWLRGHFESQANEHVFQQNLYTLTRNPQNAEAHYQLGLIYLKRRKLDIARRHFEDALKIDEADPECHYSLGRVHELSSEWPEAMEHYEATYRISPEYGLGDIVREVGKAYLHVGSIAKAREFLEFFLSRRDSDPEGRYWLAVALQKDGRPGEARMQAKMILEQIRSSPRFFRKENREWVYRARSLLRESRGMKDGIQ